MSVKRRRKCLWLQEVQEKHFCMRPTLPKKEAHMDWNIMTALGCYLCVMIGDESAGVQCQRSCLLLERVTEQKKGMSSLPHSCLSRHQTCVVSRLCVPSGYDERDMGTWGEILQPALYNIREYTDFSIRLLSLCLTLSTVISSSASAVVSSSSVLACCSWLSRAWRAACRLLIWDSRSCIDRVSSVTWRLISSFCSSCSSPIYTGRQKQGPFKVRGKWFTPRYRHWHFTSSHPWHCSLFVLLQLHRLTRCFFFLPSITDLH